MKHVAFSEVKDDLFQEIPQAGRGLESDVPAAGRAGPGVKPEDVKTSPDNLCNTGRKTPHILFHNWRTGDRLDRRSKRHSRIELEQDVTIRRRIAG